ncbi:YqzE family protein [Salsuginibacillus kocurii]|uniref:YqzE family protein n=1 Tax=Salsuginibacillus kocurii TaxID=427078 RepID=UPI00036CACCC|nr:YqzE family protein [Salsuginibacillus kocurii]
MEPNSFITYLVRQMVERLEGRTRQTKQKERPHSLSFHWFGMVPMALKIGWNKKRPKVKKEKSRKTK